MGASAKRRELRRLRFQTEEARETSVNQNQDSELQNSEPEIHLRNDADLVEEDAAELVGPESLKETQTSQESSLKEDQAIKHHRFICFIGNLPFAATTDSIAKHFASVRPDHIRHSTNKESGKSKGFAFLEFDAYARLQTCIQKFHHSKFPDGEATRRINVELTVGGGGSKSQRRQAKLKTKNQKLATERKKLAAESKKPALTSRGSDHVETVAFVNDDIHPSRRSRVTT